MSSKMISFGVISSSCCSCIALLAGLIAYLYLQTNIFGTNPMCSSTPLVGCITRNGLVGFYDFTSYKEGETTWEDKSGNDNHATISKDCNISKGNGGYVTGKTSDQVTFPEGILKKEDNYTLIHVSKYNGDSKTRKRIMTASDVNYLSGHHDNYTGVSYQAGYNWIVKKDDEQQRADKRLPLISVEHKGEYSRDNNNLTIADSMDNISVPNNLGINIYSNGEKSDWAVGIVLIYNRKLKKGEVNTIISVLAERFDIDLNKDE